MDELEEARMLSLAVGSNVCEVMADVLSLDSLPEGMRVASGSTEFELSATFLKGTWKITVELM